MPELPEVETTLRGVAPYLQGQSISAVTINHYQLRYPIAQDFIANVTGKKIVELKRRAKYLIIGLDVGALIIHLGMSGHLRILNSAEPFKKHDHVELVFSNGKRLRYNDPRRFGIVDYYQADLAEYRLFKKLGPEPLTHDFSGDYLWHKARKRSMPIKSFIMNNEVVVGVGNIYAQESLFLAGISPKLAAHKVSKKRCELLVTHIKKILANAITQGGTTLRDFLKSDGKPGYFAQSLHVYGKANQPCSQCQTRLKSAVIGQRTTVYCPKCQKA